ncbi:MAG: hypothetical protein ACPHCN_16825 [Mycobacterium sp.]
MNRFDFGQNPGNLYLRADGDDSADGLTPSTARLTIPGIAALLPRYPSVSVAGKGMCHVDVGPGVFAVPTVMSMNNCVFNGVPDQSEFNIASTNLTLVACSQLTFNDIVFGNDKQANGKSIIVAASPRVDLNRVAFRGVDCVVAAQAGRVILKDIEDGVLPGDHYMNRNSLRAWSGGVIEVVGDCTLLHSRGLNVNTGGRILIQGHLNLLGPAGDHPLVADSDGVIAPGETGGALTIEDSVGAALITNGGRVDFPLPLA